MDDSLSDKTLKEIQRRCGSSTGGPWKAFVEGRDHTSGSSFIMTGTAELRGPDIEMSGATDADLDFISHAKQDIPLLLEEIDRLKRLLKKS